ncbi:hypothetical protein KI387_020665, partial [Taxus chinensis]
MREISMFFFLLPLLLSLLPAHIVSHSYHSTQHALLAFKDSLQLDPLNSLHDWSPQHNTCNWTGIVCSSRRQRVVSLNLTEIIYLGRNQLTGTILPSLGNLSFLTELGIDDNRIHGSIPSTLGGCRSLQKIGLSYNHLSGTIPSQLGLLSHLEIIVLGGNNLRGTIPAFIGNMSSLDELDLGMNTLHGGITVELGILTQLSWLSLDNNYFTGEIPRSISNCSLLKMLALNSNQLSSTVPLEFGKLLHLQILNLWGNHLVSGSSGLSILTALTNCSSLEILVLSQNYFTGILPSSVSRLSRTLSILELSSNKFEGNIPSGIANLTKLAYMGLVENSFSGNIPSALCELPNLEILYLDRNNLYGTIPECWGQTKRLGLLSLRENILSGQIPDSLGDLPQLRQLFVHRNRLSGKIPASLGRCQNLELVDFSYNKLEGNIPPEVAGLQNLHFYFNISNNLLKGSFKEMSKMVMVQTIDVSLKNFSGEIPAALSGCTDLHYLNLSGNSFDGPIPASLTKLKNLEGIDLSRNNLSGAIPVAFKEMKMLKHINLSSNRLTGEVPKGGVFVTLDESAIGGNPGLCGTWINLQPCPHSKHRHHLVSKKVIVPILVGIAIFIMSFLLLVFSYTRRRTAQSTPSLHTGPTRISYEELVIATNGFSQANLLGVGSFGSICKGILSNATNIAVKVLNFQDKNANQSFITECDVLKRVKHRNVIKIISACFTPDFKALVLPFTSNGSLDRWLHSHGEDDCNLTLSDRLRIAMDVAQGMAYLHHQCFVQVIHCDLKPNNVLLGDDMTSYIADFGIAKLLFGNLTDSLSSTNVLKGSAGYIPPEYGMGGRFSTKGDVFSYGILLLELLTRRRPTDDMFVEGINLQNWVVMNFPNNIMEVMDNHLLKDVNGSEISMVSTCVTQFMEVGLVCTRELPQQRPSMMEVVEKLEKIR